VVLPCYAGAELACQSARTLAGYFAGQDISWELIVVDDGANDFTANPLPSDARIRLLRHGRNLGKGAAVRTGMLAASGQVRVYTDVDLPYDLDLLLTLEAHIRRGFHLAVGDRTLPGAQFVAPRTRARRLLSGVASSFIGSLVTGGYYDTQCGLKAFRGDVAAELFRLVTIRGFAFDVEVIYLAQKHRLDIKRVPVQLRRDDTSSVRVFRDSLRGMTDILGIKTRQLRGAYRSGSLEAMLEQEARLARAPWVGSGLAPGDPETIR